MAHPDMCPISFTHPPVGIHVGRYPPSCCLRLISSQTFSRINIPTFLKPVIFHTYLPMKVEHCSETSAYKTQMPGNYPEESIQYEWSCFSVAPYTCMVYRGTTLPLPLLIILCCIVRDVDSVCLTNQ
jgi:hypothetical protein